MTGLVKTIAEKLTELRDERDIHSATIRRIDDKIDLLESLVGPEAEKSPCPNGSHTNGKLLRPGEAVLEFVSQSPGLPRREIVNGVAQHGVATRSKNVKSLLHTTLQKAIKDGKLRKKGEGYVVAQ